MSLVQIMTLLILSCYFHVIFCLEAPPDIRDVPAGDPETITAMANANCDTEEIAEFNQCLQKASVTMTGGEDVCDSLGNSWQCFPKCFCDHTQSLQLLAEALKSVMNCTEMPTCGAPKLAAPAPGSPASGSPASTLRPNAVPVCIVAAVSLVVRTGRS